MFEKNSPSNATLTGLPISLVQTLSKIKALDFSRAFKD